MFKENKSMKKIVAILLIVAFVYSCGKKEEAPKPQDDKNKMTKADPKKEDKPVEKKDEKQEPNIETKSITYKDGKVELEGFLAYDKNIKGKRPGVLVAHAWMGLDEYAKGRAVELAKMGYIAFALDIYGKGVHAKDHKEAMKLSGIYRNNKDRKLLRSRARAGLKVLRRQKLVRKKRIAAIGYCFGGATVLELARMGIKLRGVVTFHGDVRTPHRNDNKKIRTKILVLHGGKDPHIKTSDVKQFEVDMKNAKKDKLLKVHVFQDAYHAFTVPEAKDKKSGLLYDATADKESWQMMKDHLDEVFKTKRK